MELEKQFFDTFGIEEKHGVKTEIITDVGPVIGAHTGPGVLAFFFVGNER